MGWSYKGIGPSVTLLTVFLCSIISGCMVGPDYTSPEPSMPDTWYQNAVKGLEFGRADLQTWWNVFDDPVLKDLIAQSAAGNPDLKQAWWRIQQARANLSITKGELFPEIDAIGAYARARESGNGLLNLSSGPNPPSTNLHTMGIDTTWEADVFGRIRRSVESADASLGASIEDFRDVMVSLYAEVAIQYVELRTLQKRLKLAAANIALQKKTLQLTKDRFNAGISPQLDVRQAELNLATTESLIPTLRFQRTEAINRIAVLLGTWPPDRLYELLLDVDKIPEIPKSVTLSLPVELLRQRPDIRRSERILASQTALIGAATAELYPIFTLSGTFTQDSRRLRNLGDSSSLRYEFGPAFRWNIFDGNRIRSSINFEKALTQEALTNYENTVLLALEEVEDAMAAYVQQQDRNKSLDLSVVASQKSVELVETLYKTGLTDFQNVLDMQRSLFNQQDELASSDGQIVQNLILIYKSLGGGWSPPNKERIAVNVTDN